MLHAGKETLVSLRNPRIAQPPLIPVDSTAGGGLLSPANTDCTFIVDADGGFRRGWTCQIYRSFQLHKGDGELCFSFQRGNQNVLWVAFEVG